MNINKQNITFLSSLFLFALFLLLISNLSCTQKEKDNHPKLTSTGPNISSATPITTSPSLSSNLPGEIENPKDGAVMFLVPAGEFIMGAQKSDKQAHKNEKPAHKVNLDAFYIYKYEVTYRQFKKFMKETGYKPGGNWDRFDKPEFLDHPVMNITFIDAMQYCKWAKVELPTEAQWEKAARGADGRLYPWGNDWNPNKCNNSELEDPDLIAKMNAITSGRGSLPVGSIKADTSPYGVMDMAGNINEWCSDRYKASYYKKSPYNNPPGPDKGFERSTRGGAWSLPPTRSRTTSRWSGSVESELDDYGFRCILDKEMRNFPLRK
ncbi:MAG: formylglycine-generating enzyme family protein [Candidatus Eremiobacteraeota bacterium]|nr:formylglycine-generating enzyme family protein [Candidatus Eremiobacteraeota bacterium]